MKFNPQVNKKHYEFSHYADLARWSSYWYQLNIILKLSPESVLEVGPGDYVFGNYLKQNTSIKYTSVDFAEDLNPDIVADLRKLPLTDSSYSVVCAFEVLEHLPFSDFETSLKELLRVAKKQVILSLPHWGRSFAFSIQLPILGIKKFNFKLPYRFFAIAHRWDGEHYFEIGKENYPIEDIRQKIWNAGGKLVSDFVPTENTYHHFFIIENKIRKEQHARK